MEFIIKFTWYDDERIWIASSSNDKFALTLDHGSFDGLLEKVKFVIYDMIENDLGYTGDVKLNLEVERTVSLNIPDKVCV